MKPLMLPAMGKIEPLPFFSKDGFGIKLHTMVDMPLNKENRRNYFTCHENFNSQNKTFYPARFLTI